MDPLKQEFVDLMNVVGWTQAETARQLCMTSGAVNQLVNPGLPVRPSTTTLRLFKLLVAGQRPEAINPKTLELKPKVIHSLNAAERKVVEALRKVAPGEQPRAFMTVHRVISAFVGPARIRVGVRRARQSR